MKNLIFQALAHAAHQAEPVTLGLIIQVKGSSPQKAGAKALFYQDGRVEGTLGGGCLEAETQRLALAAARTAQPQTFDLLLDHDYGWDDGLICGGMVRVLVLPNAQAAGETFWSDLAARAAPRSWGVKTDFSVASAAMGAEEDGWLYQETVRPPCALWIAGSGHIAQAVAPLALNLDFAVAIFDDRPRLANHQFFPRETVIHTGDWNNLCLTPFPETPVFGLIVTRGHKHDALVLEKWIHRPFQFLGMIGSARKARMISEGFVKNNLATPEAMARVVCPVGIKIASQTVPEIAISIVAQYIEKRARTMAKLK
jgi:xanthine dehydrogenase accessory factor